MNILITGAGSGIGLAAAERLAARGHGVIAGVHTQEQLDCVLAEKHHPNILFVKLDVTDPVDKLLAGELARMFDIEAYFGNASVGTGGSMAEIDMDLVRQTFETNVFSMFEIAQNVLPPMLERGHGRLIFMSSLIGEVPLRFFGPYAATKAAIATLARSLHQEAALFDADIRITVVLPGAYHTGFNQRMIDGKFGWMREGSYFEDDIPKLCKREHMLFDVMEKKRLASIVRAVEKAATKQHPRFKYVAPPSQALGAKLYVAAFR